MALEDIARLYFFSSRRRHTRLQGDWSSDVCSSDLTYSLYTELDIEGSLGGLDWFLNLGGRYTHTDLTAHSQQRQLLDLLRSEERRVGKECRSMLGVDHSKII